MFPDIGVLQKSVRAKIMRLIQILIIFFACIPFLVLAQNCQTEEPYPVGVIDSPPFVINHGNNKYSGIAIDIWEQSAEGKYYYVLFKNTKDLLSALKDREICAAVANFTLTHKRAEEFDFSYPWYKTTFSTLIVDDEEHIFTFWEQLFSQHGEMYLLIFFLIILGTVVLTFFNYPSLHDIKKENLVSILIDNFYQVVSFISTKHFNASALPGLAGKIVAALWMIIGSSVITYVSASFVSTMVNTSGNTNGLSDVSVPKIGMYAEDFYEVFPENIQGDIKIIDNLEQGVALLKAEELDAIMHDTPVLKFYLKNHPSDKLRLIDDKPFIDEFVFLFPRNSQKIRNISLNIIKLKQNGTLSKIEKMYLDVDT